MIGQEVLHYKIVEKLGEGGMGVVYKAHDSKLEREVAIKFLPRQITANAEERERFKIEAKAAAALNHPNIATIHAIEEVDDELFIVMEYIEGKELKEIVGTQDVMPLSDVFNYATQIADGLQAAHKKGIIHRDIKSANIMITEERQVKIMDFGLAKVRGSAQLTKVGTTLGTAAYMSPEQARGDEADERADIWSFGVVLYEMLTGQLPFKGDYEQAVIYSILNEEPEFPDEVPVNFQQIPQKALAKNLTERYKHMDELRNDLSQVRETKDLNATAKVRKKASFPRPRVYFGVAILLILLTVSGLTYFLNRSRPIDSIAVMPFSIKDTEEEWKWLGNAVMELLNTELAQYPSVKTIDALKWNKLQRKLGIQDDGNMSLEETSRIAREAKAQNILMGSVEKHGNNLILQGQIYDTHSGKLLKEIGTFEGNVSQFYDLIDRLSNELKQSLEFEVSSSGNSHSVSELTTQSLDAYKYYLEGRDAALDNRYKEAIPKLSRAIRLDSTFADAYYFLAWQYSKIYEYKKAKEILLKGKPHVTKLSEAERLKYLIQEASIDRRWKDHAAYIERLLELNPFKASLHYKYGYTQFIFFRNVDAGIASLEKSLKIDSTYSGSYKTLGEAYLAKGEKKKAFDAIRQYIRLNPTDVRPLSVMADMQILTGDYETAIRNCERILIIQPRYHNALYNLARAYIGQGRYSLAFKTLNRMIESITIPTYKADGHLLLARLYFLQGKLPEGLKQLQHVVELDSHYSDAHWLHGLILLARDDKDGALEKLSNLEQMLTDKEGIDDMWLFYHLKAQITLRETRFDEAIKYLQKALELAPLDRSFYLTELADAFAQSGQIDAAVQNYQEALTFNPQDVHAGLGLARALEKQRKLRQAFGAYNNVLELWSGADDGIREIEIAKKKITELRKTL